MGGKGRHAPIPAFPTGGGRPLGLGAVQYFCKRHASRGRRAVGGGREPPGVGPRGAVRLGGRGRAHAACGSRPGAGGRPARGPWGLYPFGYRVYPSGLAEAEGVAPALERGALQPQGLGGRRLIALGQGQRLVQQRALEGHRGVMIQQGGGDGGHEERRGPTRDGGEILEGDLGPLAEDDGPLDHIGQLRTLPGQG